MSKKINITCDKWGTKRWIIMAKYLESNIPIPEKEESNVSAYLRFV
jgi:hypothetical protein